MNRWIIGIDEVGRGCLAGPVTVAAVAAPINSKFKIPNSKLELRDSKKLTRKQREKWAAYAKNHPKIRYAIARCRPKTIDRLNISRAANRAATAALKRLLATSHLGLANRVKVLLDGGLFVNSKTLLASGYALNPRTVVKGDEKYNAIKLASIVAKVNRDRIMKRNHRKYPDYGFNEHVGYGTKRHIAAVKKYGPCELHRRSFIKNFV